jgi:signal transduction histidine kinase
VLVAIVPMALLLVYNAFKERQQEEARVRQEAQTLVSQTVTQQEQLIEASRQVLASLAGLASGINASTLTPGSCGNIFRLLIADLSSYSNLGITNLAGDVICSTVQPDEPTNVSNSEWFRRTTSELRFAVGAYESDNITDERALSFGYPILAADRSLGAVLFMTLNTDQLAQRLVSSNPLGEATFTLRDRHGAVIVSYPDAGLAGLILPEAPDFVASVEDGRGVRTMAGIDGVERLYAFTPVGDARLTGLYASVGLPEGAAYAEVNRTLRNSLLFLSAVGLVAILGTYLANDYLIVRPVRSLIGLTKRLSEGDLSARVAPPDQRSELGQLEIAFNEMSEALESRIAERERAEMQLKQTNSQLEHIVAELKRSNADLEQFAYVASHDLQEPLRMISSYTQLLARRYEGKLDSDADEFIGFAVDGAKRMQTLINDLLDFSRVGTNKNPFQAVDLEDALNDAMLNLKVQLEEAGAVIQHDKLPVVRGDKPQLTQVIQNLIGNAVKFRGPEAPRIRITGQREGELWRLSIADNGIGIPADQMNRIFVIFQRLHSREEYPGTGIGLAISKRIVERHGGRIWAESEPGAGTTFHFLLQPATDTDVAPVKVASEAA